LLAKAVIKVAPARARGQRQPRSGRLQDSGQVAGQRPCYFLFFTGRCQPSMVAWRARATVSLPAGTA